MYIYIYIYIYIYAIYIYNKYFIATRHLFKLFCVISDPQHTECSNLTEAR